MLLQELLQLSLQEEALTRGPEMDLSHKSLASLKGQHIPHIIDGDFECQGNHLFSLEYGPKEVTGNFECCGNQLSSLQYGPTSVKGSFWCHKNQLTSLQYCPTEVGTDFLCGDNRLTSLAYCPTEVHGDFKCVDNKLTSLAHAPIKVGNNFDCDENQLTSLEHCPTKIGGNCKFQRNQLTSLQGIHKLFKGGYIKGEMYLDHNLIVSHILGLLLIPELKKIQYKWGNTKCVEAIQIINKHLAGDRDVIDCQQELIEAGLKEYAQL